MSQTHKMQFK